MNQEEALKILSDQVSAIDILTMFFDHRVGSGCSRDVYSSDLMPDLVLKIDKWQSRDNILEWEFWQTIRHTKYKKWFAPLQQMSTNGRLLVQQRAEPINKYNEKFLPKLVPNIFSDLHKSNFGFIGKQLVSVDYSFSIQESLEIITKGKTIEMIPLDFYSST